MTTSLRIRRALISVSDKFGITAFAEILHATFGVEILSTGGTAKVLRDTGIPVTDVSAYTGFPECFDGRVKTLHPKIHGGLLFMRGNPVHEAKAIELGILPIDLVAVNLYPFEQTVAMPGVTLLEAIEQIDIGGPSMLRSAAKNFASVTVVSDPKDYNTVLREMSRFGTTSLEFRRKLAEKVFRQTSRYDAAIATKLAEESLPAVC